MDVNPLAYRLNILWCFFAPVFIVGLIKIGFENKLVFSLKDALFILTFFYFSVKGMLLSKKVVVFYLMLSIFVFYLLLNWIFFNPEYDFFIANFRQIIMPILLFALFSSCTLNKDDAEKVYGFVVWTSVLVFLIGFFCLYLNIWENVNLKNFFTLKGIPVNEQGMSYMFYEPILGYMRRMVSTMLDPISLGHSFASVFISVWFFWTQKKNRYVILLVLFFGVIATLSKGALLQVAIACVFLAKKNHPIFKLLFLILIVLFVFWLPNKDGLYIHFEGTYNAFTKTDFFGYGIGNVGNYAKMFNPDLDIYNEAGISDTYLGSVLGQIGWFGFSIWIFLLSYIVFFNKNTCRVSKVLLFSILLVSVLSENTLNFSSIYLTAILAGLNNSMARKN